MPNIELACTNNYTTIPNHVLQDTTLSWEARGLLDYLYSFGHPVLEIKLQTLDDQSGEDDMPVDQILQELDDKQYIMHDYTPDTTGVKIALLRTEIKNN